MNGMVDLVLVEDRGPVRVLTLNDPRRANPLSPGLVEALTGSLEAARGADGVRALVLTGAGRHFSAGADLEALETVAAGGDATANREDTERLRRLFETLLDHPLPTLAAVHGAAVAGGCGLATACDLVVAERSARFAYTEVRIGFVAALVLTFLVRRVPGHVARRMLLDPTMIPGSEAVSLGLADRLVEDGEAVSEAVRWGCDLASKGAPSAIAATKRLLNDIVGLSWRGALDVAAASNLDQRLHSECRRGVKHFLDQRSTPDWLDDQTDET
jgi:methylglutaconyl-CoA hydratase